MDRGRDVIRRDDSFAAVEQAARNLYSGLASTSPSAMQND